MELRQYPTKDEDHQTPRSPSSLHLNEEYFPKAFLVTDGTKHNTDQTADDVNEDMSTCVSRDSIKGLIGKCNKQTCKEASKNKIKTTVLNTIEKRDEKGARKTDKNLAAFPNNKPGRDEGRKSNKNRTKTQTQCVSQILADNCVKINEQKISRIIPVRYETEDDLIPECHSLSSISECEYDECFGNLEVTQRLLQNDDIVENDPIQTMLINAQIDKQIGEQTFSHSEENCRYTFCRIASLAPALESKPPSYMWLALFTILFNFVIGLIALVIAMQSDHEYWKENITRAKKLGRVVKLMCILAISTTCLTIVVVSIVLSSPNKN